MTAFALEPVGTALEERDVEALVASVLREPARRDRLVDLLQEDAPIYAQRSRAAIVRMRGWVLAGFEKVGLPDDAIPFVIEELESGTDAYLVSAAARAVRGRPRPDGAFAPYLVQAIRNIQGSDDLVTFAEYGAYALPGQGNTATGELLTTLRWMGSAARAIQADLEELKAPTRGLCPAVRCEIDGCLRAIEAASEEAVDCCALPLLPSPSSRLAPGEPLRALELEDQSGTRLRFEEVFLGQPTIVAFFYTRCDNPWKCSLTICKLANVQRKLAAGALLDRISTAAVTYDPAYDLPGRLSQYGRDRSFTAHPRHRLLRSTTSHDRIRSYFGLGVGFIASLVNRHRIECFVLDSKGRIYRSFTRLQWEEDAVIAAAKELLAGGGEWQSPGDARPSPPTPQPMVKPSPEPPQSQPMVKPSPEPLTHGSLDAAVLSGLSAVPSVLLAFFPKCPVCWATYLSMLGVACLERLPYAPWLFPLFGAMMIVNLASLGMRVRHGRSRLGFWLVATGSAVLWIGGWWLALPPAATTGVLLTLVGSFIGARGGKRKHAYRVSRRERGPGGL